jgi:hypothetical protein
MSTTRRTAFGVVLASVVALGLTGYGAGNGGTSSTIGGEPRLGGTLQLLGSGDVDHLDTASAYYTTSYTLERAFTRQRFGYPASTDETAANTRSPTSRRRSPPAPTAASARTAARTRSTCAPGWPARTRW